MERPDIVHNVPTEQLIPEAAPHQVAPWIDICATDTAGATIHVDVPVASLLCSSSPGAGLSCKPGVSVDVLAWHKASTARTVHCLPTRTGNVWHSQIPPHSALVNKTWR